MLRLCSSSSHVSEGTPEMISDVFMPARDKRSGVSRIVLGKGGGSEVARRASTQSDSVAHGQG